MTRPPARPQGDVGDLLGAVLVLGLAALAVGHWLIGNVAALLTRGHALRGSDLVQALQALWQLPHHGADPRQAWPAATAAQLPGPVLYWTSAALVLAALALLGTLGIRLFSGGSGGSSRAGARRREPIDRRRRLGVPAQAAFATTRQLAPLRARRPEPGRLVLARQGRQYLMTEATQHRSRRGERGVRGAVAVFGPSQSGKTTGLITSVQAWTGAAVICSVKADLLRATLSAREGTGQVQVYDPLGITGLPSAAWSPLRAAASLPGALAAAQTLARAGEPAPQDAFWRGQAEQLLAGMLWTAANTNGRSMSDVVKWVLDLDRPGDAGGGQLAPLVRLLTDDENPQTALNAKQVQGWLHGQWNTDPRTTSSVYATARNAVWPWADPQIAASAHHTTITLDALLEGNNTLYLCAPLGDETRLGLVFAAVLHDLTQQAFDRYNHNGTPADPPLLLLIDEAANTPLPKLPQWASTVSGAGIQLVTVWQSKAQIDQLYGRQADNVLTNHRTKLFYPSGLADPATTDYLSTLAGTEHVRGDLEQAAWLRQADDAATGRTPAAAVPLLTASILRQMRVGDTLLIHGHLPPAWIKARRTRRDL
jgi:type IV secretion system protein VirD4